MYSPFNLQSIPQKIFTKVQRFGFQFMIISVIESFIDTLWLSVILGIIVFWAIVIIRTPDTIVAIMPFIFVGTNIIRLFFIPFEWYFVILCAVGAVAYLTGFIGLVAIEMRIRKMSSMQRLFRENDIAFRELKKHDYYIKK